MEEISPQKLEKFYETVRNYFIRISSCVSVCLHVCLRLVSTTYIPLTLLHCC